MARKRRKSSDKAVESSADILNVNRNIDVTDSPAKAIEKAREEGKEDR